MGRFSTDTLVLHTIAMGATPLVLRGIGSASHGLGIQTIGPDSGNPYDETKFIGQQQPTMDFSAVALESLLGELSLLTGLCVLSDGSHPGVEMYGQGHDPCGTSGRTAGSTNMKVTAALGHALITQVGGGRNEDATAALQVMALSDGATEPTAAVYNAALPASPVVDEAFIVGAPTVAGQALSADSVQSVTVETGIQIEQISAIDEIWPTAVDIIKVRPIIRITLDDPTILDAAKIKYQGVAATHANTFVTFVKRDPFGGLKSKALTEHIKITAAGIAYVDTHYNASGSGTGTVDIVIECIETGGAVPLVVTTGVAI